MPSSKVLLSGNFSTNFAVSLDPSMNILNVNSLVAKNEWYYLTMVSLLYYSSLLGLTRVCSIYLTTTLFEVSRFTDLFILLVHMGNNFVTNKKVF